MINLMQLPANEAERLAYSEGFVGTAELFARIAALEAERDALETQLDDAKDGSLARWERNNGPADAYKDFFNECFERLAGVYPCPNVTSDYDKSVIFDAIERAEGTTE